MEWAPVDEQQRQTYRDLQEATEWDASGLAILLMKELTGKVVVERARKGPGYDYWLSDVDDNEVEILSGRVRLEVSGILHGDIGQVATRLKQKLLQIAPKVKPRLNLHAVSRRPCGFRLGFGVVIMKDPAMSLAY